MHYYKLILVSIEYNVTCIYNIYLLYIEYHDIPWIDKYRIQKQKPKLRYQSDLIHQMKIVTIKHQIPLTISFPLLYYLLNYFGDVSVCTPIP